LCYNIIVIEKQNIKNLEIEKFSGRDYEYGCDVERHVIQGRALFLNPEVKVNPKKRSAHVLGL
jgi:hypothetical protein